MSLTDEKKKTTARAICSLIMEIFLDLITSSAGAPLQSGHAFTCHPYIHRYGKELFVDMVENM